MARFCPSLILAGAAYWCFLGTTDAVAAEPPAATLSAVFPPGAQAGTIVTVAVEGTALAELRDLRSTIPGLTVRRIDGSHFALTIPAETPPGVYDLRAVGLHGLSSPRPFFVSARAECLETEPNDSTETAQLVPLDSVINGRIGKPGDVDVFRFEAKAGQRVVLECFAERIDSQLRAVLEVYDKQGKRLAVNRGHSGVDPLIDFRVPADGTYSVKVFDLSFLGGNAHLYRLDIDTKPRVEFAVPCVVSRGRATRVKLFGRNLGPRSAGSKPDALESVEVEVTPPAADVFVPMPRHSAQLAVDVFPWYYPGGHAPVLIGVTDVPVVPAALDNHTADRAQELAVPCEVCGQLTAGDERHWYTVTARRGEVLWLEAFGERIGSPVNLDVTVLDASGQKELAQLAGCTENLGDYRFPTVHSDPAGRWVVPADGRYLILVRNLIGGLDRDPRRLYRLSVRREEPDFHLAVVSRRTDQPAGMTLPRGGRERFDVIALRRRGLTGPIRVAAENLPPGIECPDIWIGPGQDRATLVLTASRDCAPFAGALRLVGRADLGGAVITRPALGGSMVWPGRPMPWGRLTQEIPLATGPDAGALLTASPARAEIDQDSILDVEITLERRAGEDTALQLACVGLPRSAVAPLVRVPAGRSQAWLSVYFPASLPPGPYSFAIQAEPEPGKDGKPPKNAALLVSNHITVQVRPARIILEPDPRNPHKIRRGEIIQLRYTAERTHGFIGKIHTELAAPGGVHGVRARGVTFVGQQDSGSLQVIATETAPLGRLPLLRLEAVGTVEDRPMYRAGRFVELEITE